MTILTSKEEERTPNSIFNQLAVSHLLTDKYFKDSFSLIDRFVH